MQGVQEGMCCGVEGKGWTSFLQAQAIQVSEEVLRRVEEKQAQEVVSEGAKTKAERPVMTEEEEQSSDWTGAWSGHWCPGNYSGWASACIHS